MSARETIDDLFVVATRELQTVIKTPALIALAGVFAVSVIGVAWAGTGGSGGFVPLILDLLTFVEVLVPLLAFAFGYRAILDDRLTGELDMLRTFDVDRVAYVGGVYVGRAVALVGVVIMSLLVAGVLVPTLTADQPTFLAQNRAADSALRFLRFVALSAGFTLVALAVTLAVSAAARTLRSAFVLATVLIVAFVVGVDTALIAGLASGVVPPKDTALFLAVSPNSAFRGLVLTEAVGVVGGVSLNAGNTLLNAIALLVWWLLGLGIAVWRVWSPIKRDYVETNETKTSK